ncbi:hypothetical protein ACIRU8_38525 [Streptomyces sp. NPDC101175]
MCRSHVRGHDQRIADQAVAFLVTAATATVPVVPSDDVDLGLEVGKALN